MTYAAEIAQVASLFKLDPQLVTAQVSVESDADTNAWNPEPRYRYFWDVVADKPFRAISDAEMLSKFPPKDFHSLAGDVDQEWWAQQASWGLLQVMGAVAREQGFKGRYLTELMDPVIGLQQGCLHLSKLLSWSKGNVTQALAAYNGGKVGNDVAPFRNQAYALKVLALMKG